MKRRRRRHHRSPHHQNRHHNMKWHSDGGEGREKHKGKSTRREPIGPAAAEGNRLPNPPSDHCLSAPANTPAAATVPLIWSPLIPIIHCWTASLYLYNSLLRFSFHLFFCWFCWFLSLVNYCCEVGAWGFVVDGVINHLFGWKLQWPIMSLPTDPLTKL